MSAEFNYANTRERKNVGIWLGGTVPHQFRLSQRWPPGNELTTFQEFTI